jgi:hypothetical protein
MRNKSKGTLVIIRNVTLKKTLKTEYFNIF